MILLWRQYYDNNQNTFQDVFFWGGTDIKEYYEENGGSVISSTFDKYCYVNVRHLPKFFDYTNYLSYSKVERVPSVEEIEHPAIREAMKYLDMHELCVIYDADLPGRSGLGTSSSFAVGMLQAFYSLKGKYVSKEQLAKDAIYLERTLCKEAGGEQDQVAAAYGGLNRIDFSASGFKVNPIVIKEKRKEQLNDNLMLFFTGFSRFSAEISKSQVAVTKDKTKDLNEMKRLVVEAEKILVDKYEDLNKFGLLLDYTWQLKRGLTDKISNDTIDSIYLKAKNAGAIGGKLLGAGGGGFLLLYVEKDRQESMKKAMKDLLHVPFRFEDEGTRILYYKPEEFELEEKEYEEA